METVLLPGGPSSQMAFPWPGCFSQRSHLSSHHSQHQSCWPGSLCLGLTEGTNFSFSPRFVFLCAFRLLVLTLQASSHWIPMGRHVQDNYLSWFSFQAHSEVLSKCIFRNAYLAIKLPKIYSIWRASVLWGCKWKNNKI